MVICCVAAAHPLLTYPHCTLRCGARGALYLAIPEQAPTLKCSDRPGAHCNPSAISVFCRYPTMSNDMPTTLIDALQNPALYDHPVERFEVVETHISWVLLTGPYAYKIKKPVDLGFLDFSTLEKRRFY